MLGVLGKMEMKFTGRRIESVAAGFPHLKPSVQLGTNLSATGAIVRKNIADILGR
jgi:hypothetical protein